MAFALGAVTAFARRCHGVYCARVELSLTAFNGRFFMKIDEKDMQILNMTKANIHILDALTCLFLSQCLSNNKHVYYSYICRRSRNKLLLMLPA